jgi:hypothetical protein
MPYDASGGVRLPSEEGWPMMETGHPQPHVALHQLHIRWSE